MNLFRNISALLTIVGMASVASAAYQTPIMFSGNFSENFDEMSTGTTVPAGWDTLALAGSHDEFAFVNSSGTLLASPVYPWDSSPTSTFIAKGATGSRALTTNTTTSLVVNTFSTNTGVRSAYGYNFGLSTSTADRALGTSPTGIEGMELQLGLQNTTGGDLNAFNIAYDIRRFTTTTNNNNYAGLWDGTEEFPGYSFYYSFDGNNWTNVAALNPQNLVAGYNPTTGPSVPNTQGVTSILTTTVTLGSTWTNGSTLLLRWYDDNAQGPSPDQNIGLDNVVVSSVPEPASMAIVAVGALALLARRRRA